MYDVCFKDGKHFSETNIPIIGSKNPWEIPIIHRHLSTVRYVSPSRVRFRKFELAKILKKMPSNQLLRSLTKHQTLSDIVITWRFCPKDSVLKILTPQKSWLFWEPQKHPCVIQVHSPETIGGSNRGFLGWDMLTPKKSTSSPAAGTRTPLMWTGTWSQGRCCGVASWHVAWGTTKTQGKKAVKDGVSGISNGSNAPPLW